MSSLSFTLVALSAALVGQKPAVEMPGKTNQEILGNCLTYLQSTRASDRSFAIATMGLMGKDAKVASRQICQAFLDTAPEVRQAANLTLPQVNKPLYQPIRDILNTADTPEGYLTRLTGVQNLAQLGVEAAPAVPVVVAFMTKAAPADRLKIVAALAVIGARDLGVTELFGTWLRTYPDTAVRLEVLKLLPQMTNAAGQVNNLLAALQAEESAEVRALTILTLGKLARGNADAIKALTVLAASQDAATSEAAQQALAELKK